MRNCPGAMLPAWRTSIVRQGTMSRILRLSLARIGLRYAQGEVLADGFWQIKHQWLQWPDNLTRTLICAIVVNKCVPNEAMMLGLDARRCTTIAWAREAAWDTAHSRRQEVVGSDATGGCPGTNPRQQHPRQGDTGGARRPPAGSGPLHQRGLLVYRGRHDVRRGTRSQHPHPSEPRNLPARRSARRR
jgi:hypothetical protein